MEENKDATIVQQRRTVEEFSLEWRPPQFLKPHCEITMAQKRCQQGSKLISGSVTLKRHFGDEQRSKVSRASCDKNRELNPARTATHQKKHLSTSHETLLSCHVGCLKGVFQLSSMPSCFGAALCTQRAKKEWRKRLLAAWNAGPVHAVTAKCCCLFHMEINAPECSQLPNKWLWLFLLHTRRWKAEGL